MPGVDKYLLRKDERKLFSVMKLSLDWMIENRVANPVVVGILIQGNASFSLKWTSIMISIDINMDATNT